MGHEIQDALRAYSCFMPAKPASERSERLQPKSSPQATPFKAVSR